MKIISEYIKKVLYNKEDVTNHHGVAAIIKNENGDILIQKHNKFGFWTIPVGKVKPTQTVISGLKQEIKEECNVDIIKQSKIGGTMSYQSDLNNDRADVAVINASPSPQKKISSGQLWYMNILLRKHCIWESDFTEAEYANKRSITFDRADKLIKLGLARKEEVRVTRILSIFN